MLNCAGNCALRACELDSRLAWRTNVEGLINLLSIIVERDVRLVHLSIDLVFSGERAGRPRPRCRTPRLAPAILETDPTDPVTVYGKTMVAAEQLLADWMPEACMLRISLPMGVSFNGHAGAIDWIQSRFKKGRPATLYFDEVRTPAYTDCLNRLYERVLASDLARPLPRRRPAGAVALPDRASHQSRRRLRPELLHGLPARSKPARFRRAPATSR